MSNTIIYETISKAFLYKHVREGFEDTDFYQDYGYTDNSFDYFRNDNEKKIRFNPIQLIFPKYLYNNDINHPLTKRKIQDSKNLAISEISTSYNTKNYPTVSLPVILSDVLTDDEQVGLFKVRRHETVIGIISVKSLMNLQQGFVYIIHLAQGFDIQNIQTSFQKAKLEVNTVDYYKGIQNRILPEALIQPPSPAKKFYDLYNKL